MPVVPTLRKLNQEDHRKFENSLDFVARFCFKNEKNKRGRGQLAGEMSQQKLLATSAQGSELQKPLLFLLSSFSFSLYPHHTHIERERKI